MFLHSCCNPFSISCSGKSETLISSFSTIEMFTNSLQLLYLFYLWVIGTHIGPINWFWHWSESRWLLSDRLIYSAKVTGCLDSSFGGHFYCGNSWEVIGWIELIVLTKWVSHKIIGSSADWNCFLMACILIMNLYGFM